MIQVNSSFPFIMILLYSKGKKMSRTKNIYIVLLTSLSKNGIIVSVNKCVTDSIRHEPITTIL